MANAFNQFPFIQPQSSLLPVFKTDLRIRIPACMYPTPYRSFQMNLTNAAKAPNTPALAGVLLFTHQHGKRLQPVPVYLTAKQPASRL